MYLWYPILIPKVMIPKYMTAVATHCHVFAVKAGMLMSSRGDAQADVLSI